MNNIVIIPSNIGGKIAAPPSKSITHRAVVLASLTHGTSIIHNPLICDDTKSTVNGCKAFGVKIKDADNRLVITGTGGRPIIRKNVQTINVGLSGTSMRFLTTLAAISKGSVIIDGKKELKKRPMKDLVDALKLLGASIRGGGINGNLPIRIKGTEIIGGELTLSGESSSQFISAFLMIAPLMVNGLRLKVLSSHSSPYIDLTCLLLETFGISVERPDKNIFNVQGNQKYTSKNIKIEGDFSSASYFFAAAAITKSKVTIPNLNSDSLQADRLFLDFLLEMGCAVRWNNHEVTVSGNNLQGININMGNCPDIVPSLVVTASFAKGITNITNIGHLRFKESDRLKTLTTELSKMGVKISQGKDSLTIIGSRLHGAVIDPHQDHRIAMSLTIAGLAAKGETVIKNPGVVNKSYPDFFTDLKKLGAKVENVL
jgi:3-phosphoshikimate 1-carboxyvinyltransferase